MTIVPARMAASILCSSHSISTIFSLRLHYLPLTFLNPGSQTRNLRIRTTPVKSTQILVMSDNVREKGTAVKSRADLPPPRERKGVRPVSPPLSNTSLRRFIYYLALFAAALFAFYAWRFFQWKAEVGGWWNLATGHRPGAAAAAWAARTNIDVPGPTATHEGSPSVEQRINELAQALGVPSKDLAAAIAGAVKEYVPPATLSSIASHETGDAAQYLVDPTSAASSEAEEHPTATMKKGFRAMESAVEAMVGLDDPPSEIE